MQSLSVDGASRLFKAFTQGVKAVAAQRRWLREQREPRTQWELRKVARAHALIGERERARGYLERALEIGGPFDAEARAELDELGSSKFGVDGG